MKTAIIINLDYENQPIVKCRQLWAQLEVRMQGAGFTKESRRFVTDNNPEVAGDLAKAVMDAIENEYVQRGSSIRAFIRDFYSIPYEQITDLLAPSLKAIDVDLLGSGAFESYFGKLEK
jgi:hypothetical protein